MLLLKAGSQWQKYFRARLALFINGLMGGLFVSLTYFVICEYYQLLFFSDGLKIKVWYALSQKRLILSLPHNLAKL